MAEDKKKKGKGEVEEAEINLYMEEPGEDAPTDYERIEILMKEYEGVKVDYKRLITLSEIAKSMKDEAKLNQFTQQFRHNYKARHAMVRELRELGCDIEDRFVPKKGE